MINGEGFFQAPDFIADIDNDLSRNERAVLTALYRCAGLAPDKRKHAPPPEGVVDIDQGKAGLAARIGMTGNKQAVDKALESLARRTVSIDGKNYPMLEIEDRDIHGKSLPTWYTMAPLHKRVTYKFRKKKGESSDNLGGEKFTPSEKIRGSKIHPLRGVEIHPLRGSEIHPLPLKKDNKGQQGQQPETDVDLIQELQLEKIKLATAMNLFNTCDRQTIIHHLENFKKYKAREKAKGKNAGPGLLVRAIQDGYEWDVKTHTSFVYRVLMEDGTYFEVPPKGNTKPRHPDLWIEITLVGKPRRMYPFGLIHKYRDTAKNKAFDPMARDVIFEKAGTVTFYDGYRGDLQELVKGEVNV